MPSEKVLEKKKQQVEELAERLKSSKSVVLADYRGLTVEQDTQLRRALREEGVTYSVVKNSLTKFALQKCGFNELEKFIEGPISIATHQEDPVVPARLLAEYAKKFEHLELKAGIVEGEVMGFNAINSIASLPSKEVLISKVLAGLNSPIAGFVNVLNGNIRGLVVALNAIAEKKS